MSETDLPVAFRNPLARDLWEARRDGRCVNVGDRPVSGLDLERAGSIALELYNAFRAQRARRLGWKLGATDAASQARLGATAPFSAPVFDLTAISPDAGVSMKRLVAPIIEAEIGVSIVDGIATPLPCVEIADSRFAGWPASIAEAVADFGLQGYMLFGEPAAVPGGTVDVVISRDGEVIERASRPLAPAMAAAEHLRRQHADDDDHASGFLVATGNMVARLPLSEGSWQVDFGPLGRIGFTVDG